MPLIRAYPEATVLQPEDALVIDREGVGTMFIEADNLGGLTRCITYVIDGGGSVIGTGVVGDLDIPFSCTISAVTLLADQSGSVVVDIWSAPYASYPPTISNTIVAAHPPTITSATHAQDTTLTGWTTLIPAGNTLRFNVNSVSSITRLVLALTATG